MGGAGREELVVVVPLHHGSDGSSVREMRQLDTAWSVRRDWTQPLAPPSAWRLVRHVADGVDLAV